MPEGSCQGVGDCHGRKKRGLAMTVEKACHCEERSDAAIPVGEAHQRECLGYGDCHGRKKRGLAMTGYFACVIARKAMTRLSSTPVALTYFSLLFI